MYKLFLSPEDHSSGLYQFYSEVLILLSDQVWLQLPLLLVLLGLMNKGQLEFAYL